MRMERRGAAVAAAMVLSLGGCAAPAGEREEPSAALGAGETPPMRQDAATAGAPTERASGTAPASGSATSAPLPAPPAAEETRVDVMNDAFRPEWWLEQPVEADGTLRLSAMADAATVRDSRRGAVTQGEGLAAEWSGVAPRNGEVERVRTVRLPSKYYRTFVTMSWAVAEPKKDN